MSDVPIEGVTRKLVQSVLEASIDSFPALAIERGKALLLDGLGNMLAGSTQDVGGPVKAFVADIGGAGKCTVAGTCLATSAPWAALANGAFCRALDFDPPHPGHHPVGANLPSTLAVAEHIDASGGQFLEAFILGVETQARIKLAPDMTPVPPGSTVAYYGRGVPGTLSSAVAVSKLLGLDEGRMSMAIGIAAALTGGIESAGTMCNPGDSGQAASRGVQAALLAQRGFTGRPQAIEQKYGFGQFLGANADLSKIADDFANPLIIVSDNISIKKYPCQYPTHRPIDAIVDLYSEKPWEPDDIERIDIEVALMTGDSNFNSRSINNRKPANGLDGKFSVHYTAAAAAVDGMVRIDSFSDEKRFSPVMERMLDKIHVIPNANRPSHNRDLWAEVRITFRDGVVRSRRIDLPKGHAEGQPLSASEREAKFLDCALRAIDRKQADRILDLVGQVERLTSISALSHELRTPA